MNRPIRAALSLLAASSFACAPTVTPLAPAEGEVFETLDGETNLTAEVPAAFAFTPAPGTSILPETFAATIQDRVLPPFDATPFFAAGAAGALGVSALPPGKYRLTASVENDRGERGTGAVSFRVESPAATFAGGWALFDVLDASAACANPLHEALMNALLDTGVIAADAAAVPIPSFAEAVLGSGVLGVSLSIPVTGLFTQFGLTVETDARNVVFAPEQQAISAPQGFDCALRTVARAELLRTSDISADVVVTLSDFLAYDAPSWGYCGPWPFPPCPDCPDATIGFIDSLNPCAITLELVGRPAA
ncbi:MAG: hypothetical protein K8I02_12610 [Candidatus Methylomirabilis sp.]|nr:hypothetical protein [Deltaproteobacteria bacterium]